MTSPQLWLDQLLSTGGDLEAPPLPIIPVDYLPNATQKHRTALEALEPPDTTRLLNPSHLLKRFMTMDDVQETLRSPSPSKRRRLDNPNTAPVPLRLGDTIANKIILPNRATRVDEAPGDYDSALSESAASAQSTSVTGKRSLSPTKRMADLRVAAKKVEHCPLANIAGLPAEGRALHARVQGISDFPVGVVPKEIQEAFEKLCGDVESPSIHAFATKAATRPAHELFAELHALNEARVETSFCTIKHVSEPSWNERVHSRILRQAVQNTPGLAYHNITTAKVIEALVPHNKYGEILKKKMVDYAIVLGESIIPESIITARLAASPLSRTVNPTHYAPIRHEPIAISIKTNTPNCSEEGALVTLSMWVSAHLNRLRIMLLSLEAGSPIEVALPLVYVSGDQWHLKFAFDREETIEIIESVLIGSTATLLGCYKILAALRILTDYATSTFKEWLSRAILTPE
ncbi:hypothetical protein P154DRAFT_536003 [Amniculicola lignicola CBS 123094]|uniref:PD-(D/E)XK nuclease-like domain-containing protein n=1 Tax=Amniculicola lignicola CBS 123094 TaxID=1392246 RepID=A0A6A5WBV6_9PLEO|nr:hypothetical protein P154DRAFT_536003 [Amniculicola lignicola CBS 123094]